MTSRPGPQRIATLTYEPGQEPLLGLRPAPERYPVPKDAMDFALLTGERVLIARSGPFVDSESRLELRSLAEWEPVPYAVLPLRPPLAIDRAGKRALAQVRLLDGFETALAVVDLDRFAVTATVPLTAPYTFVPEGSAALDDALVATLPYPTADEALIAAQPYAAAIAERTHRGPDGKPAALRAPVLLDLAANAVVHVYRETPDVQHVVVPGGDEALLSVTRDNVYVRRAGLDSGAIEWDYAVGQNRPGEVHSVYAARQAWTRLGSLLALGVYDRAVVLVDAVRGTLAGRVELPVEERARIDALAWDPSARLLAIGLASGTVALAWVPSDPDRDWRLRVFRGSSRGAVGLAFQRTQPRLLVLGSDGGLRAWELLPDELPRTTTLPPPPQLPPVL